ncbi:MAG: hypothetical protein IJU51_07620 [Clostridia bacterium]|nr:hypothetical protein [Clostridia bacterium]
MDMKLGLHGDMEINSMGLPYHIAGMEELIQRIYVLLSARKGGFIYNRELGSGISEVSPDDPQAVPKIEACARKALESIPEAEVTGAAINDGQITVTVSLTGIDIEIIVRGDNNNGGEL